MSNEHQTTIRATQFSYARDCWVYAMTDRSVAYGKVGDARVLAGLPFNEQTQWAANQVFGAPHE